MQLQHRCLSICIGKQPELLAVCMQRWGSNAQQEAQSGTQSGSAWSGLPASRRAKGTLTGNFQLKTSAAVRRAPSLPQDVPHVDDLAAVNREHKAKTATVVPARGGTEDSASWQARDRAFSGYTPPASGSTQ